MQTRFGGITLLSYVPPIITDIPQPVVTGYTSEAAGATVTVTIDGYNYAAVVNSSRMWSITPNGLVPGTYTVTVTPPVGSPVAFPYAVKVLGGAKLSANNGDLTTTKLAWSI